MKLPKSTYLCTAALVLAACGEKHSGPLKSGKPTAISVEIKSVRSVPWDRTIAIVGTLFPKDKATLGAEVEGVIEKTMVEFGDRVIAGQDLATIDRASYEAQLQQAEGNLARAQADLANARQNFERTKSAEKSGGISQRDLESAAAQLAAAEAGVKAAVGAEGVAKLRLERSAVKMPFDGGVANRIVGRGDFVKIGSPLFEVVNDKVLKFIFAVPERHGSQVKKKLPVTFNVDNYPGETFTGDVYLISPVVSTESRLFNVGALVQNPDLKLKASTFARGTLKLESDVPTTVAPISAIVTSAGVTKVFVIESGVAKSRTVSVGRIQGEDQEVTDGVKPGEYVAVSGQRLLFDGATVSVKSAPETAQP